MAQFMESERGHMLLVLDNFKFSKVNRPLASRLTKWRCIIKTCKAFVKIFGETTNITEQNVVHDKHSANRQVQYYTYTTLLKNIF